MEIFNPNNPYIALDAGRLVHLLNPKPQEFTIADIAHGLSNLCRFTGHTTVFYSVAEHSCHVSDYVRPENRLYGLLHDASEAFLGDVSSPLKSLLPEYVKIEGVMSSVIYVKYGLDPERVPFDIKETDTNILVNEAQAFLSGIDIVAWGLSGVKGIQSLDLKRFGGWSPDKAYDEFMKRFMFLY